MFRRVPPRRFFAASGVLVWFLILLLSMAAELSAAMPQGGSPTPEVRIVNLTQNRRHDWAVATIPFQQGTWTPGQSWRVNGVPSELRPFGQRWPDGSVRFARMLARVDLQPGEERVLPISRGSTAPAAFRYSPWVQSRLPNFDLEVIVGVPGVGMRRAGLNQFAVEADTTVEKTTHYRDRIPGTDLVCDLWLTFLHDQDTVRYELRLTNSSTGSTDWEQFVDFVALAPTGCIASVRGSEREGIIESITDLGGLNPVLLLGPTSFFDGQAYEWFGELAFIDPAVSVSDSGRRVETILAGRRESLWGVATNWRASDAYNPFGYLPEPPSWITDDGRQAALDSRAEFMAWYLARGEAWENRPRGLLAGAAATGNQDDFGVGKFVDTFVSGMPHGVLEARYNAGEEAHRPVHFREVDGAPVDALSRPQWVALNGRTHWSSSVSVDRLGKPYPERSSRGLAHEWTGKDHEHWSSMTLAAAYLLTGSHSLKMEMENDIELYLASHTLPAQHPGKATSHPGNPRATGRTLLTMSWYHLLLDRPDVAARMVSRIRDVLVPEHVGLQVSGPVKPMHTNGPDVRTVTSGDNWSPWEESQAVIGLVAASKVTGDPVGTNLGYTVAKNIVMNGWLIDFDRTQIGYALRFLEDGQPLPRPWLVNPEHAHWGGPLFKVWALPATRLAVSYAFAYQDLELIEHATFLRNHIENSRTQPRARSGWDEYASWDLVR